MENMLIHNNIYINKETEKNTLFLYFLNFNDYIKQKKGKKYSFEIYCKK